MIRPGFALAFALLLSLLLSAIALGIVTAGTTEAAIAAAAARRAHVRALAEAGARTGFRAWSTRAFADLEPGEGRQIGMDEATTAIVERVDSTLYLIRVEARVSAGSAPGAISVIGRAGLLVIGFDPTRTRRSFPAAAAVAGSATITAGTVDGRDPLGSGRDVPGLVAASLDADPDAVIRGSPPVLPGPLPEPPRPAPLAAPLAGAIATIRPLGGTIAPRPVAHDGVCVPDPSNWGAPVPDHPCHTLLPVVYADHHLTISGGQARAVIVVDGGLRVVGGAALSGLLVVRDTLTVEAGSSIHGAVRAGSLLLDGGAIHADPRTVDDALSAPALDRGYRPPARWWVPVF